MAGAETQQRPKPIVDRGLSAWQTLNKITLTAELSVAAGGLLFGVPWLVMLGTAGAAVDGVQMAAISEVQKRREKTMKPGKEYALAA